MYSYEQYKKGFTYLYIKREVCLDGIHTKPLNFTLKPIERKQTKNDRSNFIQQIDLQLLSTQV